MNTLLIIAAVVLVAIAVVSCIWLLRKVQQLKFVEISLREKLLAREAELSNAKGSLVNAQGEAESLVEKLQALQEHKTKLETSLELERKHQGEKHAFLSDSKEQLGEAFENIANKIFEDKSKKLSDKNKESLSTVLNPLQDKIRQFEKRVEDTYDKESKERFSLAREIKQLQELNSKIAPNRRLLYYPLDLQALYLQPRTVF